MKKSTKKKILIICLFTFIWGFLVGLHGLMSSVTVGKLEWQKYNVLPSPLTVEAILLDNQVICCSICVGGKETELCINYSPTTLYIDTSNSLLSSGNRHITLEDVVTNENTNEGTGFGPFLGAPMVNYSTLKAGEKGDITFTTLFQLYQRLLTY